MGLRQSSYCPRGRTRRGAIYNSTVMTRSWAVAASYFLQQEQVHPALPSTDKTKVSQPQHRLCAEPDNSLLLDKPCACTTFNNLPGLCPLAASNTAPRVITMKGPDPTSCPQGERGVGGKTHPQLRGTELNKEKKKSWKWGSGQNPALLPAQMFLTIYLQLRLEIKIGNPSSFRPAVVRIAARALICKDSFRKANLESSLQARSPTHTSHWMFIWLKHDRWCA